MNTQTAEAPSTGGAAESMNQLTALKVNTIAKMETEFQQERNLGERVADKVSLGLGSWTFLIVQSLGLILWIAANVISEIHHWDPYPFILLNLALSFQSAYATPLIIMSQNRQSKVAERRNHLDLQINLLAEQETTAILRMLQGLCAAQGIQIEQTDKERTLEEPTRPEALVKQIRQAVEAKPEKP